MNNFPVSVDGKEYWISRSVAVCAICFCQDNGLRVLAVKRGPGCPDEVGKWCCPCGYLDYNETLIEACCREVKEETNLTLDKTCMYLFHIDDSPKSNKQNITFTYVCKGVSFKSQTISAEGSEPNEIDDVEWVSVNELDKYDWAFNHAELIEKIISEDRMLKNIRYIN